MKTNPNDLLTDKKLIGESPDRDAQVAIHGGLTKREYFAAMAMSGMIGKKYGHVDGCDEKGNNVDAIECAVLAVIYADALIAQLNSQPPTP